jgi:AraC family transcriptional regulator, transcriptional activator of pobA
LSKEIPKVDFDKSKDLNIQIMSFDELLANLRKSKDHDPYQLHRIEFFLILINTHGSFSHFVDFKSYRLEKGDAIFIAKNQVHHFSKEIKQCRGFCIIFRNVFSGKEYYLPELLKLNRLFNYHLSSPLIRQKEFDQDNLTDIASSLHHEFYFIKSFAKAEILNALLQALLLKAERAKEAQLINVVNPHWLDVFSSFKEMLEKEFKQTRNARIYASELAISYKHLNDIVKELSGKTAKEFIDDYVIIEIKRYIASTPLSVKEISFMTGFEEPTNMIKFFKKKTQKTPLDFRHKS